MDGYARIDGVKMAYTLRGRGPALVLLHGWACNRGFWRQQIPLLARTHQFLAPDFRGHGGSDVTEEHCTIEQLAEDVHGLTEALDVGRFVLVGHSMGGMVAQQFCLSHGDHVAGLVLVTTIAADAEDRLISKQIEKDSAGAGYREAFDRYFSGWFGPAADAEVARRVREEMLRTPESVALDLVRSYWRFDLRSHLSALAMSTLVIGAACDASAVPVQSAMLADLIPAARLAVIGGAGHFPMLEMPEEFNNVLTEFLSTHEL